MAARRPVERIDADFFVRWIPSPPHLPKPVVIPDLVVDVVRGADLVATRVEAYGAELLSDDESSAIVWGDDGGYLVSQIGFQHIAERAIYETKVPDLPYEGYEDQGDPSDEDQPFFTLPEQARPAKGSRLVFEVPAGYEIPFTISDILAAFGTLEMAVHPLALPRPARVLIPPVGPVLGLGAGAVGIPTAGGLVVAAETSRRRAPDVSTTEGLVETVRHRRLARAIVARLGAAPARGVDIEEISARSVEIDYRGTSVRVPGTIGVGGVIPPIVAPPRRPRPILSREPEEFETAIEAPYRLIISPSAAGGWIHATSPVAAEGAPHRIELWHSRLGVRVEGPEDSLLVDETNTLQRVIRAIWARDREAMNWEAATDPTHEDEPFRSSLDGADRHMLVRQSSESWIGQRGARIAPEPVDVRRLAISTVGAWLDFHGSWDTDSYTAADIASIESWDHVAPMGRDQFVKVVYPGYLWPFGHRASLVKLTERKMKTRSPSVAGLYQRMFLVVKEPVRRFDSNELPLTEVRIVPLVTPTIDPPPSPGEMNKAFVPRVKGIPFDFILHCRDHEDRAVRLVTPLTWVNAIYDDVTSIRSTHSPHATVAAEGQKIAFAPVHKGGDTITPTSDLTFDAERIPDAGTSTPRMTTAHVTVDVVEQLSRVGPVEIEYFDRFVSGGFEAADNVGEVWASLTDASALEFGGGASSGSDKAGGFIQPDLMIKGLSRAKGVVNDLEDIASGDFKPEQFLANVLPKLFGLVKLVEILELVGLDLSEAPDVVSQTLDRIEGFLDDLERVKGMVEDAVREAEALVDRATSKAAELQQQAQAALDDAQDLEEQVEQAAEEVIDTIRGFLDDPTPDVAADLVDPLQDLRDAIDQIRTVAPQLPPLVRRQLQTISDVLEKVIDAADLVEDIVRWVNGLDPSSMQFSYRYEWRPKLHSWPAGSDPPVLGLEERSLVLAVEGRLNGKGEMGVDALAELKDFSLNLLPGAPLVSFEFDHLSFLATSDGKTEVDVVLGEIEFVGILGFIEVLKELIPFDGFSDPPYLDVTSSGLTAGFTQDLPNVAVGVFNLSNLSLGADIRVPFLGEMVTVGFSFCRRERPFTLAVLFIGGGGFFAIRLSPERVVVLELALEAGAVLAVDFGVASGSVSAMIGIYMRLEGDTGSLSGYFRLRGEVDVLGLISASIELYLELSYDFDTGKMVGRASLTVKVEVLFFSASVTISAERQFAGSNGDPNFVDVMGLEADGSSPAWTDYCLAYAGA